MDNSNKHHWHMLSAAETAQRLETDPQSGLSSVHAAKRLAHYGANELMEKRAFSVAYVVRPVRGCSEI